jgi:hypothetical protein
MPTQANIVTSQFIPVNILFKLMLQLDQVRFYFPLFRAK